MPRGDGGLICAREAPTAERTRLLATVLRAATVAPQRALRVDRALMPPADQSFRQHPRRQRDLLLGAPRGRRYEVADRTPHCCRRAAAVEPRGGNVLRLLRTSPTELPRRTAQPYAQVLGLPAASRSRAERGVQRPGCDSSPPCLNSHAGMPATCNRAPRISRGTFLSIRRVSMRRLWPSPTGCVYSSSCPSDIQRAFRAGHGRSSRPSRRWTLAAPCARAACRHGGQCQGDLCRLPGRRRPSADRLRRPACFGVRALARGVAGRSQPRPDGGLASTLNRAGRHRALSRVR